MGIVLSIIGWVAWTFSAYLALSLAFGCREYVRNKLPFQWGTAVQAFFWWVITVVFLFTPLNKLHILWLIPVLFFVANFLVLPGIPLLSPVILFLTSIFMKLVLVGTDYTMGQKYKMDKMAGQHQGMTEITTSVFRIGLIVNVVTGIIWAVVAALLPRGILIIGIEIVLILLNLWLVWFTYYYFYLGRMHSTWLAAILTLITWVVMFGTGALLVFVFLPT